MALDLMRVNGDELLCHGKGSVAIAGDAQDLRAEAHQRRADTLFYLE